MQNERILILASGKLYGPFPDQSIAGTWLDNHDSIKESHELYSMWDTKLGTAEQAHECGSRLPSIEEVASQTGRNRKSGAGAAMLLGLSLVVGLGATGLARASCCIPPNLIQSVVTQCGKPVAVYVTTQKGFLKYDGPIAVQIARQAPYNLRVEAGCK